MSAVRLSLLALVVCLVSVQGRPPASLFSSVLAGGLSRLWRPWARPDPSRGPDRAETIRSVSTDPDRLDDGLDFAQRRRKFRQVDREFSVFNHEAAAAKRTDRRRGFGQERADRPGQERWGGVRHPARRGAGPVRRHLTNRREGRRKRSPDDSVRPLRRTMH